MTTAACMLLCLPLLLSLAACGALLKLLCLLTSLFAILLSVAPGGAALSSVLSCVFPWAIGMTIASGALYARFRRNRF